jgi:hypothetical protein
VEEAPARSGIAFGLARAAFWSATWALGVAIGVALGGWLTLVGGSGAPGTGALNVAHDLFGLPALVGAIVFGVLFVGRLLLALFRHSA